MSNNKVSFALLHGHHCHVCKWRREAKVGSITGHYVSSPRCVSLERNSVGSPRENAFEPPPTFRRNIVVAERPGTLDVSSSYEERKEKPKQR